MAEVFTGHGEAHFRRCWLLLGLLIAFHGIFNLFFNPFSSRTPGDEFPTLVYMGAILSQPVLFAIWASIGPPPATKRIPLTVAALAVVVLAGAVFATRFEVGSLVLSVSLFVALMMIMLLVRKTTHWRIVNVRVDSGIPPMNQFSLKYLLLLTAICAVLLGIGRGLALSQQWEQSPSWQVEIPRFLARVGILLVAIFPAIVVPLVVMLPRATLQMLIVTVVLWAPLTWLAIETIVAVDSPPRSEVAYAIVLLHFGVALAGLVSALVLRKAGYRLVRSA